MKEAVLEFLRWLGMPVIILIAVAVILLFAMGRLIDSLAVSCDEKIRHHW